MNKTTDAFLDANKMLDSENIRITLLYASLYLSAFELLRSSLIEDTKSFFVILDRQDIDTMKSIDGVLELETVNKLKGEIRNQIAEYEQAVQIKYNAPEQHALVPSCNWLQSMGALSENDVADIKKIRDQRNQIAHNMPKVLFADGISLDVDLFTRIREILRKLSLFWARQQLHFNLETLEELDISQVKDDDIWSGREVLLQVMIESFNEYVLKFTEDAADL